MANRMHPHAKWFFELFGFVETRDFAQNRAMFSMKDGWLLCNAPKAPYPKMFVGKFETPSVAELTKMAKPSRGGLRFQHMPVTGGGVVDIIANPSNAGAVFQVASQFNALEMIGPDVTPHEGVAIYAGDPTQGPKCAMACPAATVFRNYLYNGKGQGERQIDCLSGVGQVVRNEGDRFWYMRHGYCMPSRPGAMAELGALLNANPALVAQAEAALKVGVHWETQVAPPGTHSVCQVFASALPVSYCPGPSEEWAPFARLVLRAAYDATLLVARALSDMKGGPRVRVYLTALGGGAFGNREEWIVDAINAALLKHADAPLDVFLVHYGHTVPRAYADVGPPPPGRGCGGGGSASSVESRDSSATRESKDMEHQRRLQREATTNAAYGSWHGKG